MAQVKTGLDQLVAEDFARLEGLRVGLLVHPASVDGLMRHATDLLADSARTDVRALFGPQHGIMGQTQDNMIEWRGFTDARRGVPVHSLYGQHRQPTPEMLAGLDVLVIDLQDIGARYYTFIWTLWLCLEACAAAGVKVMVLDRPNPLGGLAREGNVLDLDYRSFVGLAAIPMRHGLTIGELATMFALEMEVPPDLEVVEMRGWRRAMTFDETGLPWILPSPNMPTLDTAFVYPGGCLLEGTNLSEGRGTHPALRDLWRAFHRGRPAGRLPGRVGLSGGGFSSPALRTHFPQVRRADMWWSPGARDGSGGFQAGGRVFGSHRGGGPGLGPGFCLEAAALRVRGREAAHRYPGRRHQLAPGRGGGALALGHGKGLGPVPRGVRHPDGRFPAL